MTTQEHTHDSAMSGEVKEKWEDDFINKYESFQFSESVSAPEMQRYLSYIRQQRSLAQQEILDRVDKEFKKVNSFAEMNSKNGREVTWKEISPILLSTLKDTNI